MSGIRWFHERRRFDALVPIRLIHRTVTEAKGFSPLELERAGLTEKDAAVLGIPVDPERNNSVGTNVMQLRRIAPNRPRTFGPSSS
jgi:ribosomal protein L13E